MPNASIRAVLFDFGGVITSSPFDAFRHFERERGLPSGFLQRINVTNARDNAWAQFERGELTTEQFDNAFASESVAAGHEVRGLDVLGLLNGAIRPRMLSAVERCQKHFTTACLTNNFAHGPDDEFFVDKARVQDRENALDLFDAVIESSKVGVRKPEFEFYEHACKQLSITPSEAVFLDDLGVNLKPARQMGMHTIKVVDPDAALDDLATLIGIEL